MFCFNEHGEIVEIEGDILGIRPAVYGILIENGMVLLQPSDDSDLWMPPGKILDEEETPTSAVLRCFQAAASITPTITGLLMSEDQCWLDEEGQPWQLSILYYALKRPTAGIINFDSPARPEWISFENLNRDKLLLGYEAIEAGFIRMDVSPT